MLETLPASSRDGGGGDYPPAPPSYDGDMAGEHREGSGVNRLKGEDLRRMSRYLGDVSLYDAVYGSVMDLSRPVYDYLTIYPADRSTGRHSSN